MEKVGYKGATPEADEQVKELLWAWIHYLRYGGKRPPRVGYDAGYFYCPYIPLVELPK